ncbi:MAG: type III secretion system chaperone [Pseudomonadota bacterium]
MPRREVVDVALLEFGSVIGIRDCKLNDNESLSLSMGENVVIFVSFDDANERLVFMTDFGEFPSGPHLPVMEQALRANMLGRDSLGATFALEPETNTLVLLSKLDGATIDGKDVTACVERHLAVADAWIAHFDEAADDGSEKRETSTSPSFIDPTQFA